MKEKPWGRKRIYNPEFERRGIKNVVWWDVLPISNGEIVKVIFESVNSEWAQAVWVRTDLGLDINEIHCPSAILWQDTAPQEIICKCYTSEGYLSIYNAFRYKDGRTQDQTSAAGMLVEEIPNGRRYRCNDVGFDTTFDKLVFRIERVKQS